MYSEYDCVKANCAINMYGASFGLGMMKDVALVSCLTYWGDALKRSYWEYWVNFLDHVVISVLVCFLYVIISLANTLGKKDIIHEKMRRK